MNEAWIWQYIFLGEGGGDPHNVDIILGGVVTKWCLIRKRGGGIKNLGKSHYIISECFQCNL